MKVASEPDMGAGSFFCCGVRIDALTLDAAVEEIVRPSPPGAGRAVHLCNAYTLSLAHRDEAFRQALNRGDLNLADGMPLSWMARYMGFVEMTSRVYGPDLMRAVVDRGRATGVRHFLYGSTPAVLQRLAPALQATYPGANIVGSQSPPFRPLRAHEADALTHLIRRTKPDIVWVGLGTPKQDTFVDQFRTCSGATLVAVGAAFDYLAGTKRQAPRVMQDHGLEWAYRLAREPKRLWRRYLVGNAVFVAGTARRGVAVTASRRA